MAPVKSVFSLILLAGVAGLPASLWAAERTGGTFNALVNPEPTTLMLGVNQAGPVDVVGSKIYESLLTYDFDLMPQPGLARSWEVSDDGLTYTFELQPNAFWHDGTPFTASDVVFSTTEFLPTTNARARSILSHVASVEATDDHTVVFRLERPFAPFINAWVPANLAMVPKHIYEGTDFRTNPANADPIGTGPFKFAEWERGQFIRLERFDQYWQENLPELDEVYFHILPDASARAVALETGRIDFAGPDTVELFDIPRLLALDHLDGTQQGSEFQSPMTWIEINHRNPPLDDARFRQAMLYALDREFIRDSIWGGYGVVASGPIASTTLYHDPSLEQYAFDPDRARALLDEMGLQPNAAGVRASISLIPLPYGETWRRLAEYIRQAYAEVGIEVTVESVDVAGWVQRVSNWEYDITINRLSQFGDPAIGVARTYVSTNINKGVMFNNTMGYVNPKVDELFAAAAAATSQEEAQRHYSEVQRLLVEDVPVAWLLEIKTPTIYNNKFENVIVDAIGERSNFASIRLAQ